MKGRNEVLGGGGFHHVALRVPDFDAAVRFYTEALGCAKGPAWGEGDKRICLLDTGDGSFLEVFAGGAEGAPPEGAVKHVALNATDVDGAIERVRAAGAEVTVEPKDFEIPSDPPLRVRLAFFKGPGGEIVELFNPRD